MGERRCCGIPRDGFRGGGESLTQRTIEMDNKRVGNFKWSGWRSRRITLLDFYSIIFAVAFLNLYCIEKAALPLWLSLTWFSVFGIRCVTGYMRNFDEYVFLLGLASYYGIIIYSMRAHTIEYRSDVIDPDKRTGYLYLVACCGIPYMSTLMQTGCNVALVYFIGLSTCFLWVIMVVSARNNDL